MVNSEGDDPIGRSQRLKVVSGQTRLHAIQSQLTLAFSFCAMAETELSYKNSQQALELIQKARHIAETVTRHLAEPNHVPQDQVVIVYGELERLETRISDIEVRRSALS
jgi:hypothetical protein